LRKPLNMKFDEADLAKEYHDFHLAAFLDHQIIGILLLKPMDKTLIKMRQVAVDSNFQGKGVGKKLVDFAETFCLAKGYNKIELHARDTAIPFYQTLNYEIEDFSDFVNKAESHFKFKSAKIASNDIRCFYNELGRNKVFKLRSHITGPLNNLKFLDLSYFMHKWLQSKLNLSFKDL